MVFFSKITVIFYFIFITGDQKEKLEEDAKKQPIPSTLTLSCDVVHKFTFPNYVPPNVKDDMVRVTSLVILSCNEHGSVRGRCLMSVDLFCAKSW